jgi:hypothetical protein
MAHGFDDYRVFVSAPGDLEPDRQASCDAIAHANEAIAMPAKILLVTVGLRDNDQISSHRSVVSDNVRWSSYFIQIFQDDWGPRDLFRKLFLLAMECRDDSSMPMREVVVLLKDAPNESSPEILAFRSELEGLAGVRIFAYSHSGQIREYLQDVCAEWAESLIDLRNGSPTG